VSVSVGLGVSVSVSVSVSVTGFLCELAQHDGSPGNDESRR